MHVKIVDGVSRQTYTGAIVTVLSCILVLFLVHSELRLFFKKDIETYVLPDSTVGVEEILFSFDVQFDHVPCDRVSFVHEVMRGGLTHASVDEEIKKEPANIVAGLQARGCRLFGSKITEKVAGMFQFRMVPDGALSKHNEETYGARAKGTRVEIISHKIRTLMFHSPDSVLGDENDRPSNGHFPMVSLSIIVVYYCIPGLYPLYFRMVTTMICMTALRCATTACRSCRRSINI